MIVTETACASIALPLDCTDWTKALDTRHTPAIPARLPLKQGRAHVCGGAVSPDTLVDTTITGWSDCLLYTSDAADDM
eukprot:6964082-Prymnesium_polylepis.2